MKTSLLYAFYKPLIRLIALLVVLAGNMRDSGHGKYEYMQSRILNHVRKELEA